MVAIAVAISLNSELSDEKTVDATLDVFRKHVGESFDVMYERPNILGVLKREGRLRKGKPVYVARALVDPDGNLSKVVHMFNEQQSLLGDSEPLCEAICRARIQGPRFKWTNAEGAATCKHCLKILE
jgi:hypothetical protein